MQYPKAFIDALEFMWGEGFLSPGGPEDVAALIGEADLRGRDVLDIGSGLGGVDQLLVTSHGAAHVVGIDVQEALVAAARARAEAKGLVERISYRLVEPGPLPFASATFDVVFSKDSIVHIPDKPGLYRDILRVLKPGGRFVASDWLFAAGAETHPAMIRWLSIAKLEFAFITPAMAEAALAAAGFVDIAIVDRNQELKDGNRREVEALGGPLRDKLARIVGRDMAESRLGAARGRQEVLDLRLLLPSHIRARKP
jgi:phosphoethanolamine N-methyltransferase